MAERCDRCGGKATHRYTYPNDTGRKPLSFQLCDRHASSHSEQAERGGWNIEPIVDVHAQPA